MQFFVIFKKNNTMEEWMRPFAGLVTALVLATVGASGATSSQVKVAEQLSHLQQEDLWGEAGLRSEKVRSI